jgi:hypothetical protein
MMQTASRRVQNAKSAAFHKNILKRGDATVQTAIKEVRGLPVGRTASSELPELTSHKCICGILGHLLPQVMHLL